MHALINIIINEALLYTSHVGEINKNFSRCVEVIIELLWIIRATNLILPFDYNTTIEKYKHEHFHAYHLQYNNIWFRIKWLGCN